MSEVLETQHFGYSVSPVSPLFHNSVNVLVTDNNKGFSVSVSHYRHSTPLSGYALLDGNDANEVKAKTIKRTDTSCEYQSRICIIKNYLPDSNNRVKKLQR